MYRLCFGPGAGDGAWDGVSGFVGAAGLEAGAAGAGLEAGAAGAGFEAWVGAVGAAEAYATSTMPHSTGAVDAILTAQSISSEHKRIACTPVRQGRHLILL